MLVAFASIGIASAAPAFCEIASQPVQYEGQVVEIRAAIKFSHPESWPILIDPKCTGGLGAAFLSTGDHRLYGGLHVTYATFTGVIKIAPCSALRPPGSSCGPYLDVQKIADVDQTKLCWGKVMITANTGRNVPRACQESELVSYFISGKTNQQAGKPSNCEQPLKSLQPLSRNEVRRKLVGKIETFACEGNAYPTVLKPDGRYVIYAANPLGEIRWSFRGNTICFDKSQTCVAYFKDKMGQLYAANEDERWLGISHPIGVFEFPLD